jgi:hypothetical protein
MLGRLIADLEDELLIWKFPVLPGYGCGVDSCFAAVNYTKVADDH